MKAPPPGPEKLLIAEDSGNRRDANSKRVVSKLVFGDGSGVVLIK